MTGRRAAKPPSMDACYTSIMGGFDPVLHPAPPVPGVEFVCFTDDPDLTGDGWETRVVERPEQHPRMRAKWFKCHPHLAFPDADRTLWLDGSHRILSAAAVLEALDWAGETGIAAHHHPRGCIYAEAKASMDFQKYQGLPVVEQAESYRAEGHPEGWGLWACGSLARARSDAMDAAMEDWWSECLAWTYQDQVSFPVVMRRASIRVTEFPHAQYCSPWFEILGHARGD